jgi:hypothetical protein
VAYKYPSLRTTLPVAGYYARLDAGSAATDQFTTDGAQDGTLTNGATRASSPLAYSLDGVNDNITFASNMFGTLINGATGSNWSMWFNPTSLLGTSIDSHNVLVSVICNLARSAIAINIRTDTGNIGKVRVGGRSATADGFQSVSSTNAVTIGAWNFFAATFNYTAKTIAVNLNGTITTASVTFGSNTYVQSSASFADRIGISDFNSECFQGLIDDAVFYAKAMSATDNGYLASQRGAIYQLLAGSSPINGQSLIRPADSKPYQQLIGV